MVLQVFDHNITFLGWLSDINDFKFTRRLNAVGNFSFRVPLTSYNLDLCSLDHIINLKGEDGIEGIIQSTNVDVDKQVIEVSGATLEVMMQWRSNQKGTLIWGTITPDGTGKPEAWQVRYDVWNGFLNPAAEGQTGIIDNFRIEGTTSHPIDPTIKKVNHSIVGNNQSLEEELQEYCTYYSARYWVELDTVNKTFNFHLAPLSTVYDKVLSNKFNRFNNVKLLRSNADERNSYCICAPIYVEQAPTASQKYAWDLSIDNKNGFFSRRTCLVSEKKGRPYTETAANGAALTTWYQISKKISSDMVAEGNNSLVLPTFEYSCTPELSHGFVELGERVRVIDDRVGIDIERYVGAIDYVFVGDHISDIVSFDEKIVVPASKHKRGIKRGDFNSASTTASGTNVFGIGMDTSSIQWQSLQNAVYYEEGDYLIWGQTNVAEAWKVSNPVRDKWYAFIIEFNSAVPNLNCVGPFDTKQAVFDSFTTPDICVLFVKQASSAIWGTAFTNMNGVEGVDYRGTEWCPFVGEEKPCTALSVTGSTDPLNYGDTRTFTAVPTPSDTTDSISWQVSSGTGTITPSADGKTATFSTSDNYVGSITVRATCGLFSASKTFSVVPVCSLVLDSDTYAVGSTATATLVSVPDGTASGTFSLGTGSVGTITSQTATTCSIDVGDDPGTLTVKCAVSGGSTLTVTATVDNIPCESIEFTYANMSYGDEYISDITLTPADTTDTVVFSLPGTERVTVDYPYQGNKLKAKFTSISVGEPYVRADCGNANIQHHFSINPTVAADFDGRSIRVGESTTLNLTVGMAPDQTASVMWVPSKGTITGSGTSVSYVCPTTGSVTIQVYVEVQSKTVIKNYTMTVVAQPTVVVSGPAAATVGTDFQTTATLTGFPAGSTATWSASPSGKITMSGSGNTVTWTPIAAGTVTITATCEGISDSIQVLISDADIPCTDVSVSPASVIMQRTSYQDFTATLTPVDTTDDLSWSTDDPNGTITGSGLTVRYTTTSVGYFHVIATCGSKTGTASIVVRAACTGISISPTSASIKMGETQTFTATPVPADTTDPVYFETTDPAGVSALSIVGNVCTYTPSAVGSWTVTTSCGTHSATANVAVASSDTMGIITGTGDIVNPNISGNLGPRVPNLAMIGDDGVYGVQNNVGTTFQSQVLSHNYKAIVATCVGGVISVRITDNSASPYTPTAGEVKLYEFYNDAATSRQTSYLFNQGSYVDYRGTASCPTITKSNTSVKSGEFDISRGGTVLQGNLASGHVKLNNVEYLCAGLTNDNTTVLAGAVGAVVITISGNSATARIQRGSNFASTNNAARYAPEENEVILYFFDNTSQAAANGFGRFCPGGTMANYTTNVMGTEVTPSY